MKVFRSIMILLIVFFAACPGSASARPHLYMRDKAFKVPPRLAPRVGFWVKIFTQYGEHQEVIHHRAYPQIIFRVVDFSRHARLMHPVQLERFKDKEMERQVATVRAAIEHLAQGLPASNELERHVEAAMRVLGAGTGKYEGILAENMIRTQKGIRERFKEALQRSSRYMAIMEHIFEQEKLPVELTRLPFIESSFDYKARSSVGAAGIWQFMPATARHHGLRVGKTIDERLDVLESTRAAAKYLAHAYQVLGSWPLAITSYNHGVAGVLRKVNQLGTRQIDEIVEHPTIRLLGFASNNFYPEFLAALEVYDNALAYFPELQFEKPISITEYRLPHDASAHYISQKLGVAVHELIPLNYGVQQAVWSGRARLPKGYNLKVPPASMTKLTELIRPEPVGPAASSVYGGVVYKVRKGDSLISIAKKNDITVARLKQLNHLRSDRLVIGQRLIVSEPQDGREEAAAQVEEATEETSRTAPVSEATVYVVKAGDTLSRIAGNHGMSTKQLRELNGLQGDRLSIGQRLKIKKTAGSPPKTKAAVTDGSYTVRKGDTLSTIAKANGVTVASLKSLNGLKDNAIRVGQKLRLRGVQPAAAASSKSYTVKSGDSLWTISKKLGVSVKELKAKNSLIGNSLKIGQKLIAP